MNVPDERWFLTESQRDALMDSLPTSITPSVADFEGLFDAVAGILAARDERISVLTRALAESLGWMSRETHPGRPCLQSDHVTVEAVTRLRDLLAESASERPDAESQANALSEVERRISAIDPVEWALLGQDAGVAVLQIVSAIRADFEVAA